ncbi:MAG: right-handed parallel beta-helix repeat-containing protein [Alphaproteobacteria bacterium]|nr:right-handed parallel beta-helix repeat-containing protein [Alphaproteobacteria bacterium]
MTRVSAATNKSARRRFFLSTTAFLAASVAMQSVPALAVDDYADWDGVSIVEGQGTVTDTGLGTTTIDQLSDRAIGEAQELHIGTMGSVTINQNSKNSLFVGRVIGNHSDPTQILGHLSADGRVMIIDRNGVFFGKDSVVDASGIAVTTGDIANTDIMDGNENYTFQNFGSGDIVLEGTMNVKDAGLAAFVAPTVRNSGVINAKMGSVVFGSGEKVTLDLYGDGLVEVAVDGALGNSLLENKGTVNAEGGTVVMTAQSAKEVVDNVINNEGIINVSSVTQKGGKIILSGGSKGKVKNSGKLDASGTQGGSVKVTGQAIELAGTSEIKANATSGEAGKIEALAAETLAVNGKLKAQGEGKSGFIETSAPDVSFEAGTEINAGYWLLDPTSILVDDVLAAVLEGELVSGDAAITTPDEGAEQGAITFESTVDWSSGNNFTATAHDDIRFNANGGLNATGGGNIVLNAGDDIRMYGGNTGIYTNGGNVDLNAHEEVAIIGGPGINADGGNILINNQTGGFYGFANSLNTSGTGTITLYQQQDNIEEPDQAATIQNAIDAINNTGTGQNTLYVRDGIYNEQLTIDHDHLALIGDPGDTDVPGANSATLMGSGLDGSVGINVVGGLTDVTISGFEITNFDDGINALFGGGNLNINNNTITSIDAGIRAFNWDSVDIGQNIFEVTNPVDIDPGAIFLSANTSNIHDNVMSDSGDVGLYGIFITGDSADSHTIVRNDVSGFGTGIFLASAMNTSIEQNFINDNGTGIRSAGGDVTVFNNDLSGNTLAINNVGAETVDASGNWFGTTDEASVIAQTSGSVDVSPYLASGTDTDAGLGFQGDFSALYVTDEGAQTSGLINEAVSRVDEDGQIFVNDGLYTENVLIDKSLKLTGLSGATLQAESAGDALITVTADDVNIDPFVFDGLNLVKHGIFAQGQGTHGLVIDGNTFRNFKKSAMLLGASNHGNMTVMNNIVEGSMGQAIQVGTIQNGTELLIQNNTFGSEADPLNYIGIDVGRVRNSVVGISGNTVYAKNSGISVTHTTGSTVDVTGNTVRSNQAAVNFHGIENGSVVTISHNDLVSSLNTGIKFNPGPVTPDVIVSGSTVNITDNENIEGQGGYGIDFFPGDLKNGAVINITDNESISGFDDGIYVRDSIYGGVTVNISGNGAGLETPDGYVGYGGITGLNGNGIALYNIETSDIRDNYIHDVWTDGIHLENFGQSWIAYNYIDGAGDDGIEGVYGGFAAVYGNTIKHIGAGGGPLFALLSPEAIIEVDDEFGADGIHLRNVGGGEIPPLTEGELGFGYGAYGGDTEVYGNNISIVADDGIEILNGNINYTGNNIIGHVNGNGISVEGTTFTEINGNAISLALGNGIYVNGFSDFGSPSALSEEIVYAPQGIYAGIFDNKILLTGQNGIEVTNIYDFGVPSYDVQLLGAPGYGEYGWEVNMQGNQVAMTGENGIYAHENSSVRANENQVFAAGMGEDLASDIELINFFAGVSSPAVFLEKASFSGYGEGGYGYGYGGPSFNWHWGDGDGIRVENTYGFAGIGESVDIEHNTVDWTGGHGISVFNAPYARVSYNDINHAGLKETKIKGYESLLDLLSSGPFDDESGYFDGEYGYEVNPLAIVDEEWSEGDGYPTRRDLWASADESMIDILRGYIPYPHKIRYDSHDGIHVENVGIIALGIDAPLLSGPGVYGYDYDLPYYLIIQGNSIDHTGDDGIDVLNAGRTLIGGDAYYEGNTISNVGFGESGDNYGPDWKGADGIHVENVYNNYLGMALSGIEAGGDTPGGYYGYAVDVIFNEIINTQDDGIEIVDADSTLVKYNYISNIGLGNDDSGRKYGKGADGIHISNVGQNFLLMANLESGYEGGVDEGGYIDPYAVVVIGNNISTTQDDGIEVRDSGRTRIGGTAEGEGNYLTYIGLLNHGWHDDDPDAIHVSNVFSNPYILWAPGSISDEPTDHFYDVQIIGNVVDHTKDDGIEVLDSGDTFIGNNLLTNIGYVYGAPYDDGSDAETPAELTSSLGFGYGEGFGYGYDYGYGSSDADAIHVKVSGEGTGFEVAQLGFGGGYGYSHGPGYANTTAIVNNRIDRTKDDGIDTDGVAFLLVDANTILNAGDDAVHIKGYGGFAYEVPTYDTLERSSFYYPSFPYNAIVTNNTIENSGGDGVESTGYDNLDVSFNTITNSYFNGIYISGKHNGYVSMLSNILTDNGHVISTEDGDVLEGAGARFESGNIDFSFLDNPNLFINTTGGKALGMQFDPYEHHYTYGYGGYGEEGPAALYFGDGPTNLTIVNETLGSTIFNGYTPTGSFYVRFEDGAILDEFGNVIVIDGLNATFDGVRPAAFGGVLPLATLQFIEERLWDADDPEVNGRGQIFVGTAQAGLDNVQDFFNEFSNGGGQRNGLNVTFLGLPPVGPINPANISPAAGDEGEPQNNTPEALANIVTEAGDEGEGTGDSEQVSCWSDLSNALGTGKPVSISDDGTAEGAMKQAANCGNQQI